MEPKRYSLTETAQLVRATLKTAFPGVKFSARSKSYSGGSSIDVVWTDGPTTAQVKPILDAFQGADFDSSQDLKTHNAARLFNGELVKFNVDYVMGQRDHSQATYRAAALRVAEETGLELVKVEENGNIPAANYFVPWKYFERENVIAQCFVRAGEKPTPTDGEYYDRLILSGCLVNFLRGAPGRGAA